MFSGGSDLVTPPLVVFWGTAFLLKGHDLNVYFIDFLSLLAELGHVDPFTTFATQIVRMRGMLIQITVFAIVLALTYKPPHL